MDIKSFPPITAISAGDYFLVQTASDGAYKSILASDLQTYFGSSSGSGSGDSGGTSTDSYYSDVSLLMPFNGTISDSKGHTIQPVGSPAIITTQSVYGGSSLSLDGSSYLQITKDTSLTFGSNDFTWEGFIYVPNTASANNMVICGNAVGGASGNAGVFLAINSGHLILRHWVNANSNATSVSPVSTNAWHHVAGVNIGGVTNVFLDGIIGTSGTIEQPTTDNDFCVGTVLNNSGYASNFIGDLNWLRITNGIARYTGNFTVPTLPYTGSANSNTYKYWGIQNLNNSSGSNGQWGVQSLQFSDASGNNLCVGGTPVADTIDSNYAFDGNASTYWYNPGIGGLYDYIGYEFPTAIKPYSVTFTNQSNGTNTPPTQYQIAYSSDGTTWSQNQVFTTDTSANSHTIILT